MTARFDSELLRSFLAVADRENLTEAAHGLGRTQSAVSVQIRKLEQALDARLFERRARGMVLTAAGETLLPAARAAVGELDDIAELFKDRLRGRVRVGLPDEIAHGTLERILARFAARHPAVEIEVQCSNSVGFPDRVRRGELDIAVYAHRPGQGEGIALARERCVWASSRDWRRSAGETLPLALFDRACWWREAALDALRAAGIPHRVVVTSESTAGVLAAINAGLAVGMVTQDRLDGRMRELAPAEGLPALPDSSLSLLVRDAGDASVEAMAAAIGDGFRGPA